MYDSPSAIFLSLPALVERLALGFGILCIIKMHVRYCCKRKAIKERPGITKISWETLLEVLRSAS